MVIAKQIKAWSMGGSDEGGAEWAGRREDVVLIQGATRQRSAYRGLK